VMHMAFGVTPRQRLQPITELWEEVELPPKTGKVVAGAGAAAAMAALAIGLFRSRK